MSERAPNKSSSELVKADTSSRRYALSKWFGRAILFFGGGGKCDGSAASVGSVGETRRLKVGAPGQESGEDLE